MSLSPDDEAFLQWVSMDGPAFAVYVEEQRVLQVEYTAELVEWLITVWDKYECQTAQTFLLAEKGGDATWGKVLTFWGALAYVSGVGTHYQSPR